jgi:hypothetical protein
MLTKNEIERAVEAVRALTDIVEKMHKASWPAASDSDVLRKVDHVEPMGDAAERALDMLDALTRQVDALKDADAARAEADAMRKTYRVRS